MNLLIVEDDAIQRKIVTDAVDSFCKGKGLEIICHEAENLASGMMLLQQNSFDAAIVDLRIEPNDSTGEGNKILHEIRNKSKFPVRVISGHMGDLDPDLVSDTIFFKCHTRGDEDIDEILNDFNVIYNSGVTKILSNQGLIEQYISTVFWKHISTVLPELIKQKQAGAAWDIEKVVLRYISSHIQEYLELNIENNLEALSNIEFYIKPPIKNKIFTGDILKKNDDDSFWVVLTPACDLATDTKRIIPKAEFVTLLKVEDYAVVTAGKDANKLKNNSLDLKYHYLPNNILFNGGFINFQNIQSVVTANINGNYTVECIITNPFRKDIISRFSNYYSRQGQPVFS